MSHTPQQMTTDDGQRPKSVPTMTRMMTLTTAADDADVDDDGHDHHNENVDEDGDKNNDIVDSTTVVSLISGSSGIHELPILFMIYHLFSGRITIHDLPSGFMCEYSAKSQDADCVILLTIYLLMSSRRSCCS